MPRVHVWVQSFHDRDNLSLQWHDPATGKRRTRSAGTADEDEAKAKAADLSYELSHGIASDPSKMTWEAFRGLFEAEYLSGRRARTVAIYRWTLTLFEQLAGPRLLCQVTARTLSQFVAEMRTRPVRRRVGMAPNTIKLHLVILTTALRWAVKQGLLPRVPEAPTVKVPRKRPQPVPAESFERLLAKAPGPDWRAALLTGWLAGLRIGEIYRLEWEEGDAAPWLDFGRRRVVFPAAAVKADEDQWVPLDPDLEAALLALPRQGRRVFRLRGPRGAVLSLSSVVGRVRQLARAAGVKMSSHSLRKGFGCRHAGRVPAQVLQRLMRHANIATTMGFYANVDDAVEEAILGSARRSATDRPDGRHEKRPDAKRPRRCG